MGSRSPRSPRPSSEVPDRPRDEQVHQSQQSGVNRVATVGAVLVIGMLFWAVVQRIVYAPARALAPGGHRCAGSRVEALEREAAHGARLRVLLTAVATHEPLADLLVRGTQVALVTADAEAAMLRLRESVGRGVDCGCGPDVPCCVVAGDADLMGTMATGPMTPGSRRGGSSPDHRGEVVALSIRSLASRTTRRSSSVNSPARCSTIQATRSRSNSTHGVTRSSDRHTLDVVAIPTPSQYAPSRMDGTESDVDQNADQSPAGPATHGSPGNQMGSGRCRR